MLVKDKAPEQRYGQCQTVSGQLLGTFNFIEVEGEGFLAINGTVTRQIYTDLTSKTTIFETSGSYDLQVTEFASQNQYVKACDGMGSIFNPKDAAEGKEAGALPSLDLKKDSIVSRYNH